MAFLYIIALCALVTLLGQLTRYYSTRKRVFYGVHLLGVITIIFISMVLSKTQSGGVSWPWWFLAVPYIIPVFFSLTIGFVQDILKKAI